MFSIPQGFNRAQPSPGTPHRASSGRAGFTLTETVFVMVIVGVLASMAAPLFTPDRWRADSAVQEVAMSLNAAQRLAVLRQHDLVVTFAFSDHFLRIHRDEDNDGIRDVGEDVRIRELPENMGFGSGAAPALPHAGSLRNLTAGGQDATLTFHRNGSASTSGILYLQPVGGSMSGNPEALRALTVERATGEVRCFSYRTGSWEPSC